MKFYVKSFLDSFREKKILKVFSMDLIFFGVFFIMFQWFLMTLQKRVNELPYVSAEQIQQTLLQNPEEAYAALQALQSYLIFLAIGILFIIIYFYLGLSYSQHRIWNFLLKQNHKKRYWRWNLLHLVLLFPLLLYGFVFVIITSLYNRIIFLLENGFIVSLLSQFKTLVLLVIFLIFLFLVYYSFTLKYKVWESIGDAFHLMKIFKKPLSKAFLFILLTTIIISIIISLIQRLLFYQPQWISMVITLVLYLLLIAWMRLYVVGIVTDKF